MLIASPVAFLIWAFRNNDKRKDQQHIEENIRQSDFHKIEEWATNFPELSKVNKTQDQKTTINREGNLQIAAIYQLFPYLKGEYGDRFVRPSMEIYRSLLSSWEMKTEGTELLEQAYSDSDREIGKPNYIKAIHTIFIQELEFFNSFHKKNICINPNWIPLKNIDLKYMSFDNETNFHGINLLKASLILSHCLQANFQKANLKITSFDCSTFYASNFREAILESTNFRGASLQKSDFRDAIFKLTNFSIAQLQGAEFQGTNLGRSSFYKTNLRNANFQGANLKNACFTGDLSINDNIENKLFNVNFAEANLENANFQGANLEGAVFYGALNINEAIFDHPPYLQH